MIKKFTIYNLQCTIKSQIANQKGQILLLVFVALGVVLFTVLFIISGSQIYYQNSLYSYQAESAAMIAEAGIDKAVASLNKTGGSYNGEGETIFGNGSYSTTVTDKDATTKVLQVTGYIPNKANPKSTRTIKIQVSKGVGISFVYGLQVGTGGISMGNGATFNGSVYSNGDILGGNTSIFQGDVWVAGAGQVLADQQNDCFGVNCQDDVFIFGKSVGGEDRQDVAQSFQPSTDGSLNKISVKLKKTGSPANPTVRIMADTSGKPDKNKVLATGILSASLVTNQYGFVDVTFDTTPSLSGNTTYWMMIASQALDNTNYWTWSNDLAQGYTRGLPKWSVNWQAGNPAWNNISGDLGFKTYMGGAATMVNLSSGSVIYGNVHANTITGNLTITKDAYYQTIDPSVVVQGSKYPGSTDPAPAVFPVSEANITDWKNVAEEIGVYNGNITGCPAVLGPGKIIGNVSLENGCNIKVIAPVWITGTLSMGNATKLTLDSSFGSSSGMIIVDGKVDLGNGVDFLGSGTEGSFLMLFATYNSILNGDTAINGGNSSISGILYAPNGKVELANGASFREITAWKIELGNSAVLNYQSGLAKTFFSSGPSGSYSLVKGTYQVK